MDALRAAVQNGADAVYLGLSAFNARRGAKNFTLEELQEAVTYCHVRGVQVHLAINILLSDREMLEASECIRRAAQLGVDAFIVQDLGLVALCKSIAPDVPIHASTQMSIHSLEGVLEAAQMGVSRVVLARELPREEIAFICRNSPVEIEISSTARCACATRGSATSPRSSAGAAATAASAPSPAACPTASAALRRAAIP